MAEYSLSKFSLVLKRWSAPRRVTIDAESGNVFVDGRLSVVRGDSSAVRIADGVCVLGANAKFRALDDDFSEVVEAFTAALDEAGWPKVPEPRAVRQISAAECAAHAARDDCWLIVRGRVYDISPFVSAHPGGAAVLVHPRNAGVDVGAAFDEAGHSKQARKLLASYQIGVVAADRTSSDEDDIGWASDDGRADFPPSSLEASAPLAARADKPNTPAVAWHNQRRLEILRDHPEVADLCGHDWRTLPLGIGNVLLHSVTCMLVAGGGGYGLRTFIAAYFIGGFAKMYQFMVAHELCHDLVGTWCDDTAPRTKRLLMHALTLPSCGFNTYEYYAHMHRGHHTMLGTHMVGQNNTFMDTEQKTAFTDVGVDGDAVSVGTMMLGQYLNVRAGNIRGAGTTKEIEAVSAEADRLIAPSALDAEVRHAVALRPFWSLSSQAHVLVGGTKVVKRFPALKFVTDSVFHVGHFFGMMLISAGPLMLSPAWVVIDAALHAMQLVAACVRLCGASAAQPRPSDSAEVAELFVHHEEACRRAVSVFYLPLHFVRILLTM